MSYYDGQYDYLYIPSSEWELVNYTSEIGNYSLESEFISSLLLVQIEIRRYSEYYVFLCMIDNIMQCNVHKQ